MRDSMSMCQAETRLILLDNLRLCISDLENHVTCLLVYWSHICGKALEMNDFHQDTQEIAAAAVFSQECRRS